MTDEDTPELASGVRKRLVDVLEEARLRGFLGPGPIDPHLRHAMAYLPILQDVEGLVGRSVLDLGSGGGLPGLVLASTMSSWSFVLLDGNLRRTAFLEESIRALDITMTCAVVCGRAEEVARQAAFRGRFDAVVARGFASPPVTAECAAPFLRLGGVLVVSEPPTHDPARWPAVGLSRLGLNAGQIHESASARLFATVLSLPCPDTYPRRVGIPTKRPVF